MASRKSWRQQAPIFWLAIGRFEHHYRVPLEFLSIHLDVKSFLYETTFYHDILCLPLASIPEWHSSAIQHTWEGIMAIDQPYSPPFSNTALLIHVHTTTTTNRCRTSNLTASIFVFLFLFVYGDADTVPLHEIHAAAGAAESSRVIRRGVRT